ncbi:unnamed protein product [Ectocarpus sp. 4 AP-2014]
MLVFRSCRLVFTVVVLHNMLYILRDFIPSLHRFLLSGRAAAVYYVHETCRAIHRRLRRVRHTNTGGWRSWTFSSLNNKSNETSTAVILCLDNPAYSSPRAMRWRRRTRQQRL